MTTDNHMDQHDNEVGVDFEGGDLQTGKSEPLTEEDHSCLEDGRYYRFRDLKRFHEKLGMIIEDATSETEIEEFIQKYANKAGNIHDNEDKNIAKSAREWVATTHAWWDISQLYRDLQLSDKRSRKTAYMAILREVEKGLIERHRSKNGTFRKIENDTIKIDFKNVNPTPIEIDWPLDINEFFVTYRHNIMVVSGTPDAGKTAFFYEFIKRNQKSAKKIFGSPIQYYGSEATPENMNVRLAKHSDIKLVDWDFEAHMIGGQHSTNFPHLIEPNLCTIIDYIDLNENLYEIGSILRDIYDRLENGIVLAGLQKPFNRDMGFGKEFAMKIPTLYVSIEGGIAKILKCKNRRDDKKSPKGKILEYELDGGWKFSTQGIWHNPEDDPHKKKKYS